MPKLSQMAQLTGFAVLLLGAAFSPAFAIDTASYTYDALGRLTQVSYTNGTTVVYTYDGVGNRTSVVVSCSGSGC